MTLEPGKKLAHYEVLGPLGAGGMGEVYRARDAKLGREVALKILPAAFMNDPARLARFEREAKLLASLNHPNIAAIYGLEQSTVGPFLVLELVEGPTLAERLASGPLEMAEAFRAAINIAEALEHAHDLGVMHRDLKPANIKISPEGKIKLLDFGLAKALSDPVPQGDLSQSPTMTMTATQSGMILGTAPYMSPEQAEGKPADRRSDVWSFGCVLYEILTGKRAFEGKTVSHILVHILESDPYWEALPANLPPAARALLENCLTKDPAERLRHIGDARLSLKMPAKTAAAPVVEAAPTPAPPVMAGVSARPNRTWPAWVAASIFAAGLAALAYAHFSEAPPVANVLRFQIQPPENSSFTHHMVLSPDGKRGAFIAPVPGGASQIWVRDLDSLDMRPLTGTDAPQQHIFWSPDSRTIVFDQQSRLRKVDVTGGPVQTVSTVSGQFRGGAWNAEGMIVFGTSTGLWRVPAAGGTPTQLAALDPKETAHQVAIFLRDQRHFLFRRTFQDPEKAGLYLGSLDFSKEQQGAKLILATAQLADYVPARDEAPNGYLLFLREGQLMAQTFDDSKLELTGEAVPIAEDIGNSFQMGYFSASGNGLLAFRRGSTRGNSQYTWYDRTGKNLGVALGAGAYNSVALSPDGTRAVGERNGDIWLLDFATGVSAQFTFDPAVDVDPIWSHDGSRIAFASQRGGVLDLYQKVSSGAGNDELLLKSPEPKRPRHWSSDGKFLLYGANMGKNSIDLMALPVTGTEKDRKPVTVIATEASEDPGEFSPDPKWVAYRSNESGRSEIYVQPFPATGAKWRVSDNGGVQPRWNRNGRELFYIGGDGKLMAVDVNTAGGTVKSGTPQPLFDPQVLGGGTITGAVRWDVTPDAKKFLFITPVTQTGASPITVVSNWMELLKK